MKRTMIATLHFYQNFGSVLQAYALKQTLQKLTKSRVEILPYRPVLPDYRYFQDDALESKYKEKCKKFQDFRKNYLKIDDLDGILTDRELASQSVWESLGKDCDICVVGSDIIWGREFSGLDSVYFLDGVPKKCKRIAYAASVILDENQVTENDALFAKYLPLFDAVGMRETSAVQSIQRFTEKTVEAVLDPTLLLDCSEYEALVEERDEMKETPYLLSYFLTHDPAVVDYTNLLAKQLGLRVIHYFADYPSRVFTAEAGCFAFAGPKEFLGYVKNASFIFTNSFHGTCFAAIFRKPFLTYMAKRAMLSRVQDMALRLGLTERFFTDFRDLGKAKKPMGFSEFEQKLQKEKERSLWFLQDALEG